MNKKGFRSIMRAYDDDGDGERESERMPFTSLVIHELLAAKLITLDEFSHKKF